MIRLNLTKISSSCRNSLKNYKTQVAAIDANIKSKKKNQSAMMGWIDYATNISSAELKKMEKVVKKIQEECEVLVVVGIGGSYLGPRAAIDAINGIVKDSKLKIVYLGNTLSPTYTAQVLEYLKNKRIAINVISKSGTTLEPSLVFRCVVELAKKCWGPKKYAKYVIATTDAKNGALHQAAFAEGYEEFVIPTNIGGRYSVFTPVGLIPMMAAGLDVNSFIDGVKEAIVKYDNADIDENDAYKYAALRHVERTKIKKSAEALITYEPHFIYLAEWWKQLFGESEGKQKKGLLPISLNFTTDLHSMGQYCQDGNPLFFETTIAVGKYQEDVTIPKTLLNFDKLNYLANHKLSEINDVAMNSTIDAHFVNAGLDNVMIELDEMNTYNLGQLMYFFCKACMMSAYLQDVDPFNQPGVEIYKFKMKESLKKI